MKHRLIALCLGLATLGAPLGAQSEKIVRLASLDWEPYIGKSLPNQGFVAQIAVEAFKTQGYTVQIDFLPWARAVAESKSGKYDGLFPEYYDEARLADYVYSASFQGGPVGFLKRKDSPIQFTTLEALQPYTIGVVRGYVNEANFDRAAFLKKQEADDDLMNLRKLHAKRLDLIVIDKFVASYLVSNSAPEMAGSFEFIEPPLETKPLYIAFSKKAADQAAKTEAFNRGLAELEKSGRLADILGTMK